MCQVFSFDRLRTKPVGVLLGRLDGGPTEIMRYSPRLTVKEAFVAHCAHSGRVTSSTLKQQTTGLQQCLRRSERNLVLLGRQEHAFPGVSLASIGTSHGGAAQHRFPSPGSGEALCWVVFDGDFGNLFDSRLLLHELYVVCHGVLFIGGYKGTRRSDAPQTVRAITVTLYSFITSNKSRALPAAVIERTSRRYKYLDES